MRTLLFGTLVVCSAYILIDYLNDSFDAALRDAIVFNGWLLFAAITVQALMRLKILHPERTPLTRPTWTRMHITLGFLTILVFGMHTSWRLPNMLFEWTMWSLFVLIAASGILGAWLNRAIPFRLDQHAERISIEAIPERQAQFAAQAETVALASIQQTGTVAISNLFADQLHDFFSGPKNHFAHLVGSRRPLKQLLFQLQCAEREVPEAAKQPLKELQSLVEGKNLLDFQYAHEAALRAWLFVHLPATYGLIATTVVHVIVVYAFTSGSR